MGHNDEADKGSERALAIKENREKMEILGDTLNDLLDTAESKDVKRGTKRAIDEKEISFDHPKHPKLAKKSE
jgi:hypothetical protein